MTDCISDLQTLFCIEKVNDCIGEPIAFLTSCLLSDFLLSLLVFCCGFDMVSHEILFILNSNSIGNSRATGLSVEDCCLSPLLNKSSFIYLFILFIYLFSSCILQFGNCFWLETIPYKTVEANATCPRAKFTAQGNQTWVISCPGQIHPEPWGPIGHIQQQQVFVFSSVQS